MCECQGNPLARVTLALGLPYLLVNRALGGTIFTKTWGEVFFAQFLEIFLNVNSIMAGVSNLFAFYRFTEAFLCPVIAVS